MRVLAAPQARVIAYDTARPDVRATATADITVLRNPNGPEWLAPGYAASIRDTAVVGSTALNTTAIDRDVNVSSPLSGRSPLRTRTHPLLFFLFSFGFLFVCLFVRSQNVMWFKTVGWTKRAKQTGQGEPNNCQAKVNPNTCPPPPPPLCCPNGNIFPMGNSGRFPPPPPPPTPHVPRKDSCNRVARPKPN